MFDQLLGQPGVVEECELRSRFGFLAFHGGSLERVTDVIARAAAQASGSSYYGVVMPESLRWHLPSRDFDPAHSPQLSDFVAHVEVAVAVHGYGREGRFTTLLLGGTNRDLAAHTATHLRSALGPAEAGGYEVIDDLDAIPEELRGLHPDNPVNLPRLGGVQLELPPRPRGLGPFWTEPHEPGCAPHTRDLIEALARAAMTWRVSATHA